MRLKHHHFVTNQVKKRYQSEVPPYGKEEEHEKLDNFFPFSNGWCMMRTGRKNEDHIWVKKKLEFLGPHNR